MTRGRMAVYALGGTEAIAAADIATDEPDVPASEPPFPLVAADRLSGPAVARTAFVTRSLHFSLTQPQQVELRIIGGSAELWLESVTFEPSR
jgi:hypothetical protein